MAEDPSATPNVQQGQRLATAGTIWLYAGTLALLALAGILGTFQDFANPGSNPARTIGVAVLTILVCLAIGANALLATRAGHAIRRGESSDHLRLWAAGGCGLFILVGILWIYQATVGRIGDLMAPAIVGIIAATLLATGLFLWRGSKAERMTGSLFAIVSAILLIIAGQMALSALGSTGDPVFGIAVPLGLLATMGLLLVAVAAVLWSANARLRPLGGMALGLAGILLSIAAIVAMADVLGSDPFGVASRRNSWSDAAQFFLHGIAAITLGVAGIGGLLASLLGLAVQAPAFVETAAGSSKGDGHQCAKCASAVPRAARFCARCGTRASV